MKKLKWLEKEIGEKLKEVIAVDDSEIIDVGACYTQDCSFSFAITEMGKKPNNCFNLILRAG